MSDEAKGIVNIGDLAKPADTLVNKIAAAIGILYEPKRIVRKARAEAEAEKIKALAEIEISGIRQRALVRFVNEETKKQMNIKQVITKAIPEVTGEAKPEEIENDWIVNFFDKSKLVSDEHMQAIWAKILAGEANRPGSFSKRTVNTLSSLEKRDAQLFSTLCSFAFVFENDVLVFIYNNAADERYAKYGIDFDMLNHLDGLGLLRYEGFSGFQKVHLPENIEMQYGDRLIKLTLSKPNDNSLAFGTVILTQVGQELAWLCKPNAQDEILEFIIGKWLEREIAVYSDWPKKY